MASERNCLQPSYGVIFEHMDAAILEKEALRLSDGERAVLAERLLESLSRRPSELEAAWIKEADDRMEAYRGGRIQSVSGPGAMSDLRARFPR